MHMVPLTARAFLCTLICLSHAGTEVINLRAEFDLQLTGRGKEIIFKQLDQKLMTSYREEKCNLLHVQGTRGRVTLNRKLDREELCGQDSTCAVHLKVNVILSFI